MKRCSKCGMLKDEGEFPKDRTRKDGLHQRCKACKNEYSRRRYKSKQDSPVQEAENSDLKRCSGCGEMKNRSEYSKDRTKKDGLYHLCKLCRSAYRRKNKQAVKDPDEHVQSNAVERENIDIGVLAIVYAGDERGVCSMCGKSLMGYIPGYLHGQPVCKDCVIGNLKAAFMEKGKKK